jgi:gliding motility-associated-like protein
MGTNVEIKNGALYFIDGAIDDTQRRIYKRLDTPYRSDDCWVMTFEFTPEAVGEFEGRPFTGHFLCALTENEQNPLYDCSSPDCTGFPPGIQDAIIVDYTAKNPADGNLLFKVISKIGGIRYDSDYITFNELGQTIYIELRKECDDLIFNLYADASANIPLGDGPVYVQLPVFNDLHYIQHGNNVGGDYRRELTGKLDNVCIRNTTCRDEIIGVSYVGCPGDPYQVEINGVTYNEANPSGQQLIYNARGCDTLVIIDLQFNDTLIEEILYEGCRDDGFSVLVNGTLYNEQTPYGTEYLTSVMGCDSIIEVDLRFYDHSNSTFLYETCLGDPFELEIGGNLFNQDNPQGKVVLENVRGCDSIVTVDLRFDDCSCLVYFPNVFTPNMDGKNDAFLPVFDCDIQNYSLSIFDRWGNRVFFVNDPREAWWGSFRGHEAATGIYTYLCVYRAHLFDVERIISGDVLLLR